MQISVYEDMKSTKRSIIRQKTPKKPSRCQITFRIQLQTFPSNCNMRKFQSEIWKTPEKNVVPKTKATITINTTKWKRSCNQFLSIMSEPYLSTKSMNSMHTKKFKCLSSLHWPQTHVRNAQGHQRAVASTWSFDTIQTTIITVYDVESQKTVNTRLGKRNIWFSEVIKEFYQCLQEKTEKERHKKIENRVALQCEGLLFDITKTCD